MKGPNKYHITLIGFLAFLLYSNTINHDYAWDDQLVITQNSLTKKGFSGLGEIWTSQRYIENRPSYRPIPQSVFALMHEINANEPLLGHFAAASLYAILLVSLLYILQTNFPKSNNWLLLFIALMFSLMSVHTEVVANIKSIDEQLSALFLLWSLHFGLKKGFKYSLLMLLLFAASLLSKLSSLTLSPVILFLLFRSVDFKQYTSLITDKNLQYLQFFATLFLGLALYQWGLFNYLLFALLLMIFLFALIQTDQISWVIFAALSIVCYSTIAQDKSVILLLLILFIEILQEKKHAKSWQALFVLLTVFILAGTIDFDIGRILLYTVSLAFTFLSFKFKDSRKNLSAGFSVFPLLLTGSSMFFISQELEVFLVSSIPLVYFLRAEFNLKFLIYIMVFTFAIVHVTDNGNSFRLPFQEIDAASMTEENQIVDKNEGRVVINQPYHNILVAAENSSQKAATICRIQLVYLQKLIFPTALVHQYGTRQIEFASWKDWDVYLSIVIHLFLLWLAYYFYKQKYYIAMWGILWYFLTMSIYTNIIRLMPDTLAERFLFTPSIGFSVALVSGLYYFIHRWQKTEKKSLITLSIILLPLFVYHAYKTVDRNQDWKNNYTLSANTLPNAQNNAAINAQYALELNKLVRSGVITNIDSAEALVVKHYKRAIEIYPDFYGPNNDLASYFIFKAQPDSAFPYLLEAQRLEPDFWEHHYYLALIYYDRSKYAEAFMFFDKIIQNEELQTDKTTYPELLESYEFAGRCLHNMGKDPEAYLYLQNGINAYQNKSTYILLANLYRVTGKTNLAIQTFQDFLVLNPGDQEIINTIEYLKQGLIY